MRRKNDFKLCALRNKFKHLLLLRFHHALKNFIELLFAALVQFYCVLVEESKIICTSQRFIPGGDFKKKQFFSQMRRKIDFNLSTLRNKFQHLLLLKFHHTLIIFIKLLFSALVHFYSVLLEGSKIIRSWQRFIQGGYFKKKQFFHRWDRKIGFNLSTLRNRFQHLLLLKFHHALNIFIKLLFAALVQFYSVLVEESKIICTSQRFIHGGEFKKKQLFHRWDEKMVLNCLRLERGSKIYYLLSFNMH